MFQALTPALQAAGATIVRVSPHVARFAGVAAVVTTVSYVDYRINRDVIDPFVERQSAKLARRADRRAARIAALRRERFMRYSSLLRRPLRHLRWKPKVRRPDQRPRPYWGRGICLSWITYARQRASLTGCERYHLASLQCAAQNRSKRKPTPVGPAQRNARPHREAARRLDS